MQAAACRRRLAARPGFLSESSWRPDVFPAQAGACWGRRLTGCAWQRARCGRGPSTTRGACGRQRWWRPPPSPQSLRSRPLLAGAAAAWLLPALCRPAAAHGCRWLHLLAQAERLCGLCRVLICLPWPGAAISPCSCLPVPDEWQRPAWVQHTCPAGHYNDLATAWLSPPGGPGSTSSAARAAAAAAAAYDAYDAYAMLPPLLLPLPGVRGGCYVGKLGRALAARAPWLLRPPLFAGGVLCLAWHSPCSVEHPHAHLSRDTGRTAWQGGRPRRPAAAGSHSKPGCHACIRACVPHLPACRPVPGCQLPTRPNLRPAPHRRCTTLPPRWQPWLPPTSPSLPPLPRWPCPAASSCRRCCWAAPPERSRAARCAPRCPAGASSRGCTPCAARRRCWEGSSARASRWWC